MDTSPTPTERYAQREGRFVKGPHLSIVTSLYRSEGTIEEFMRRAVAAASRITPDFEIILVNDGSPDRVRDKIVSLLADYPSVTLIDLSRNFGQLNAIYAGLGAARGDYVFALDSDLEEPPPELLETFYARLRQNPDLDVVYGVQQYRKDGFFRRLTSNLFYWVFEHLTGIRDLQNMRILRIMTRRFVHAYLSFGDFHLFVAGVNHRAGFQKERLLVDKTYKGHSSYTFQKRLLMASNAILSFSTQPLYYSSLSASWPR